MRAPQNIGSQSVANTGIAGLLDWQPAADNLFEVSFVDPIGSNFNTTLHCSRISIPNASLTLSRHSAMKYFTLDGYAPIDEISITWREDSTYAVHKFHKKWFAKFYDEEYQCYISDKIPGDPNSGRLRDAKITLQKSVADSSELKKAYELQLFGLIPCFVPGLELDWAKPGATEYTISYKVYSWKWV